MERKKQTEVVADFMLAAASRGEWVTAEEISEATGYRATSASSAMRSLRKPGCGSFVINKRMRAGLHEVVGTRYSWVFEFQISC